MTIAATRRRRDPAALRLLPAPVQALGVTLLLLVVLVPVGYVVLASISSDLSVARGTFLPSEYDLSNYRRVWSTVELAPALTNSLLVAGSVALASAVVGLGTAYVLVGYEFRGRVTLLRVLLGLQSIPGTLLLLPVFVLFATIAHTLSIQIIGTRWGLFVTYLTFALPFSTWVMVTYLRGLPGELSEAARVDGAGPVQVLTRIIAPLSWPGLVVSAVFAFLLGWNDVLFASVMTDRQTRTAAVALQVFGATQEGGAVPVYGQLMAAALICALPVAVLYLLLQRYLVSGLTAGGLR